MGLHSPEQDSGFITFAPDRVQSGRFSWFHYQQLLESQRAMMADQQDELSHTLTLWSSANIIKAAGECLLIMALNSYINKTKINTRHMILLYITEQGTE